MKTWVVEFHISTDCGTNPSGTWEGEYATKEDAEEALEEYYFNNPVSDLVSYGDWDGNGNEELVIDKTWSR